MATKKWMSAITHKGACTPMSKSTCTPRRKALARRLKPGGDLYHGKKRKKRVVPRKNSMGYY